MTSPEFYISPSIQKLRPFQMTRLNLNLNPQNCDVAPLGVPRKNVEATFATFFLMLSVIQCVYVYGICTYSFVLFSID